MSKQTEKRIHVECTECHFSREVGRDDELQAADVIIEHGKETGHKLDTTPLDE